MVSKKEGVLLMGDDKKYKPYKSAFLNSIYGTGEIGKALSQKNRKGPASLSDRQKKIVDLMRIEMSKSKGGPVRVF
jgi:hypothetical protein